MLLKFCKILQVSEKILQFLRTDVYWFQWFLYRSLLRSYDHLDLFCSSVIQQETKSPETKKMPKRFVSAGCKTVQCLVHQQRLKCGSIVRVEKSTNFTEKRSFHPKPELSEFRLIWEKESKIFLMNLGLPKNDYEVKNVFPELDEEGFRTVLEEEMPAQSSCYKSEMTVQHPERLFLPLYVVRCPSNSDPTPMPERRVAQSGIQIQTVEEELEALDRVLGCETPPAPVLKPKKRRKVWRLQQRKERNAAARSTPVEPRCKIFGSFGRIRKLMLNFQVLEDDTKSVL